MSFCRFLSRYDYCFSGSGVLASMTGVVVGDTTWEWKNSLRKIDVFIREDPADFKKKLEVWVENMCEYLETDMRSFDFSEHWFLIQFLTSCFKREENGALHRSTGIVISLSTFIFSRKTWIPRHSF